MRRRYDLRRSDNFMYTDKVSYVCSGNGTLKVVTGFPVTSATVAFATIPWESVDGDYSSSSSSSFDSSSGSSETAGGGDTFATLPRIYVSSYEDDGFVVSYEGIPEDVGFIEFNYSAV